MYADISEPALPADAESLRQLADAAFNIVASMEDHLARLSGLFRLMTVIDLDRVCHDDRDASALTEMFGAAEDAVEALWAKHSAAFHSLASVVNPKTAVDTAVPA